MKLNPEQIDRLYEFTRQHYVEYYDLQTELVDHLANSIEEQWQQNPKLSFEDALKIEFKKFGVFGFSDVVEKRQVALNKKYNKLVWKHFKGFFTLPKIIVTAFIFVFFVQVLLYFHYGYIVLISLFVLSTILFWVSLIVQSRKNKNESKRTGKRWLFKDIIHGFGSFGGISFLPFQISLHVTEKFHFDLLSAILIATFFLFSLLFQIVILYEIPKKAEDYLKETYPEYSLATK